MLNLHIALFHIRCFERVADFRELAYVECIVPYSKPDLDTSFAALDAGAEILVQQWKVTRLRLHEVQSYSNEVHQLKLKQPAHIDEIQWVLLCNHLYPIRLNNEVETPWDFFEVFLKADLSNTLDEWTLAKVSLIGFQANSTTALSLQL